MKTEDIKKYTKKTSPYLKQLNESIIKGLSSEDRKLWDRIQHHFEDAREFKAWIEANDQKNLAILSAEKLYHVNQIAEYWYDYPYNCLDAGFIADKILEEFGDV